MRILITIADLIRYMLLQGSSFDVMTIVFILIATILLWLMLFIATKLIVDKDFASDKKIALFFASLILIIVLPIISGYLATAMSFLGDLMVQLRGLIDGGGHNYVAQLSAILYFLLFILLLKFIVGMDWKDTTFIALIGLIMLYMLYSLIPEIYFTL